MVVTEIEMLRADRDQLAEKVISLLRKHPRVGLGAVLFQDKQILLGKRHSSLDCGDQFELPGGSLEWGESWEECARREVEEETGLTELSNYRFVTAKEDYRPNDHRHNVAIFVRFDAKGMAEVMEPDKCMGWGWYSLSDLPGGAMFPPLRSLLTQDVHSLSRTTSRR